MRWVDIEGYGGRYQVSDTGLVRAVDWWSTRLGRASEPYPVLQKGRVLAQHMSAGYYQVSLMLDGEVKSRKVHRLVAAAFIGPCPDGMEVCHNDGVKTHNHAGNLRYGTRAENNEDRRIHGTIPIGAAHKNTKLSDEEVKAIRDLLLAGGETHESISVRFNIHRGYVSLIGTGRRRYHVKA